MTAPPEHKPAPAPAPREELERQNTVLPEVRQCQNPDDWRFGATAVRIGLQWGVFAPANGGHWAEDVDVADWAVLLPPGTPTPGVPAMGLLPAPEPAPGEPAPEAETEKTK